MFQVFGWVGAEGARIRIITTFITLDLNSMYVFD